MRAQLAGTPLLWATYPTEDKAHEIKLDAWLARFREAWPADAAVPFETYEAASRHWVDGTLEPAEVKAWLDQLPVQKRAAEVWRESLLRRGDPLPAASSNSSRCAEAQAGVRAAGAPPHQNPGPN